MNTPRDLLAKYIPDPLRMEPRNIGVVLWADGNVTAWRFAGESDLPYSALVIASASRRSQPPGLQEMGPVLAGTNSAAP